MTDTTAVPVVEQLSNGKTVPYYLFLRSEYGEWRMYGLQVTGEDGEKITVDLEQPEKTLP